MRCPMCGVDNGSVAAIRQRGYQCTACLAWPSSTWWHREGEREMAEPMDAPGEIFERFRVGERIGGSELCDHFDARVVDGAQPVELRVYKPWLAASTEHVARFGVLVELHRRHASAGVIPVVAAGRHDGHLFVATEPVDGRALSTLLGERVPWRRAFAIVAALCDACALAHDAGLVTGLVPGEVTVASETAPPAGDPYRASGSEHVRARMHLFEHVMRRVSPHREPRDVLEVGEHHGFQVKRHALDHLSPEQLMGKPLDGRSDIYNLGAIAYQLATTSLPFADAHGPAGMITAQLKRTPPAPSTLAPELPAAADAIILRCLARDKAHRFPDARALAAAIALSFTPQS